MRNLEGLDRLARRQHGLVTTRQCLAFGLTPDAIQNQARTGTLVPARHGVYRWCGSQPTWEMMAMAAVLAADNGAALSHASAAHLWYLLDDPPEVLELTVVRQVRLAGVRSHQHRIRPGEATIHRRIPVTTPARTLLDLAETTPPPTLGRLVDDALRRRLVTLPELDAMVRAHTGVGRRRTAHLREALSERGVGYLPGANPGEQQMDRLWEELGLPPAEKQYKIRVGRQTYVLDRAIPHLKIGIEWNGFEYHGLRSGFDHDHERRLDLISAGWLVLEFTMKSGPDRIARAVRHAVARRSDAPLDRDI